jgi:hypothetical protein
MALSIFVDVPIVIHDGMTESALVGFSGSTLSRAEKSTNGDR